MKNRGKFLGPIVVLSVFSFYQLLQIYFKDSNLSKEKEINYQTDFIMKEISHEVGINFLSKSRVPAPQFKNVKKWLSAFSASLAVVDINNDGYQDVFFNDSSESNDHQLYINDQKGHFENKSKEYGLDKEKYPYSVTRPIFADCNKDGYPEMLLISSCPQLFLNKEGKGFKNITQESGIQKCSSITYAANVFDYDNDGNLDIIWGAYFAHDFYSKNDSIDGIMPENFMDSKNGTKLILMKGDGQCHFKDASSEIPNSELRGWYFSIGIQDIFQNGRQDIFVASDYGTDAVLEQNIHTNSWKNKSGLVDYASVSRNGMGVDFSDVAHDGIPHMYVSNIFQKKEKVSGNLTWKYVKEKNGFEEVGGRLQVKKCGWSWGAKFVDFNMDGWDDLVVVNGFFGDGTKKDYWYQLSILDSAGKDVMSKLKNWPDMEKFDLMGGERDCIFLNRGKLGYFSDVTEQTIFDKEKNNGRAVAYMDMNNDGRYQLIVANQNAHAKVYDIFPSNEFNWIGLSLVGTKSNISGIGAKIFWELSDGTKSFKELRPHNGFSSQSDPRFHLGFSKKLTIKNLQIVWPSGIKQNVDLKKYLINQYNKITEASDHE